MSKIRVGGFELPVPLVVIAAICVLTLCAGLLSQAFRNGNPIQMKNSPAIGVGSNAGSTAKDVKTLDRDEQAIGSANGSNLGATKTTSATLKNGALETLVDYYPNGAEASIRQVRRNPRGQLVNEGESRSWHENGEVSSEGAYRHGKRHGIWTSWDSDGKKIGVAQFIDGEPAATWVQYYADGKKMLEIAYASGEADGPWVRWHPNGTKAAEGQYSSGLPDGAWNYWDANSARIRTEHYKGGVPIGKWTYWDANGKKWLETDRS